MIELDDGATHVVAAPFPHVERRHAVQPEFTDPIRQWMTTEADWVHEDHGFYRQSRCQNLRFMLSGAAEAAVAASTFRRLAQAVEDAFGEPIDPTYCTVVAHRLCEGDFIGIHNDRPRDGNETHRVIVHVGGDTVDGGELVLGPEGSTNVISPGDGLLVSFPLSASSYHQVRPIRAGIRTTLVYSFWSAAAARPSKPTDRPVPPGLNDRVVELLRQRGAFDYRHRSKHCRPAQDGPTPSLGSHLVDVAEILARWNLPDYVITAGLLHAAYGPLGFSQQLLDRSSRRAIKVLAGDAAERLAFLFAALNRDSIVSASSPGEISGTLDDGSRASITRQDLSDIDQLVWANLVAQAPRLHITPDLQDAARRATSRRSFPEMARRDVRTQILHEPDS